MSREIGLSRLTVFKLTDANTPTYEAGIPVPWVVNVEVSKNISEFSVFADNVAEISSSKETGASLTIEVSSDMKPSLEYKLTGAKFDKGMIIGGTEDVKPSFGVAFETVMDTGKVRKYFYQNVTFSKNEQTNSTLSDSIEAQTYTLTANCIPLPVQKTYYMVMDQDDYTKAYEEAQVAGQGDDVKIKNLWDKWFEEAPKPIV